MADVKITALTAISANPVNPATFPMPMVDLLDTSMAASGTTKKVTVNQILGAGGTATLASATITGDLTVDTSTLKVDSTNNRVGIGTASPVASFQATLSGLYGLCIQSADTNNSALNIGNDPTSGYAFIDATKTGSGSFLPLRLSTSDNERIRIETAGDVKIVTGNVVMATSGKGIDFSATASGSGTMTSELLNDYEEGTFTPTIVCTTTAGVGVYTGQNGKYTKVGNLVTFQVFLDWSAHTGTGNMRIGNLPFTNGSSFWAGSLGYLNGIALTAGNIMTGYVESGQSYVTLQQTPTGGGTSGGVPIDTSGTLIFSASYTV